MESSSHFVLFRSESEIEPYDTLRKGSWSPEISQVEIKEIILTEKGSDKDLI
jgi:hypothetical protein